MKIKPRCVARPAALSSSSASLYSDLNLDNHINPLLSDFITIFSFMFILNLFSPSVVFPDQPSPDLLLPIRRVRITGSSGLELLISDISEREKIWNMNVKLGKVKGKEFKSRIKGGFSPGSVLDLVAILTESDQHIRAYKGGFKESKWIQNIISI